jgi:hypothetical protein
LWLNNTKQIAIRALAADGQFAFTILSLPESHEGQHSHDYDDYTDKIDDVIHCSAPLEFRVKRILEFRVNRIRNDIERGWFPRGRPKNVHDRELGCTAP